MDNRSKKKGKLIDSAESDHEEDITQQQRFLHFQPPKKAKPEVTDTKSRSIIWAIAGVSLFSAVGAGIGAGVAGAVTLGPGMAIGAPVGAAVGAPLGFFFGVGIGKVMDRVTAGNVKFKRKAYEERDKIFTSIHDNIKNDLIIIAKLLDKSQKNSEEGLEAIWAAVEEKLNKKFEESPYYSAYLSLAKAAFIYDAKVMLGQENEDHKRLLRTAIKQLNKRMYQAAVEASKGSAKEHLLKGTLTNSPGLLSRARYAHKRTQEKKKEKKRLSNLDQELEELLIGEGKKFRK